MQTEYIFTHPMAENTFFTTYKTLGEACVFAGDYFCEEKAKASHLGDVRREDLSSPS
jgi:hypothetical protein